MKTVGRNASIFVLGAIAVLSFAFAHICCEATQIESPKDMGAEEYSVLPNEKALVWLSFGQEEFLADLIWIRALQYNNLKNEAHLAEHFADAILYLDPNFKAVYRWAAVTCAFSNHGTPEALERANSYLERGAKRFPLDPYYDYSIAINKMSSPDSDLARRAENRKEAITHLQLAMQKPGADPNISMLISGLMGDDDDVSQKIAFLQQAVLTERDPETKKNLQTRLVLLSQSSDTPVLVLSEKRDQWQREHHPWLPIMLDYMVSGNFVDPVSLGIDGVW